MVYIGQGLKRDRVLSVLRLSKHQYYHRPKAEKRGRKVSFTKPRHTESGVIDYSNEQVIEQIQEIQKDPDTDYGYRKMVFQLMILGFVINHKKVYRLMQKALLLKP